jgi:hypothetical protein
MENLELVAWMKRSVIRECNAPYSPDFVALHPGYGIGRVDGIISTSV